MAIEAYKTSYYDKYAFLVKIAGFVRAGFSKVDGLEMSAEVIEYNEGGHLSAHKSPGKIKVKDVSFERGETNDLDLYNFFKKVYDVAENSGGTIDADYKTDFQIIQVDRHKKIKKTWNVYGGWPTTFSVGEWDAGSSEKQIEKMVMAIDYFEPVVEQYY